MSAFHSTITTADIADAGGGAENLGNMLLQYLNAPSYRKEYDWNTWKIE